MTIRTDITIDWYEDPRIANIETASGEITVQDSHDTLATIEDEEEGHQFPFLVSSAGKENLGGGTEVGITSTLQNVQYAPLRSSPRSTTTDTVTTGGTNGFICSAATFQSDGVVRGDYVINWTDQSVSEVLTVVSETELTTRIPSGVAASSDDYAVSDVITVWETSEFSLSGGNFVAVDDVGGDLNPVFPVFGRFISKASASSATLQSQTVLEHAVFAGKVTIDQTNGTNGTDYPAGTSLQPVKTLADGKTIAAREGFSALQFKGNYTFSASDNVDSFLLFGESSVVTTLDFPAGASTVQTQFYNCEITGDVTGSLGATGCHIETLVDVGGSLAETEFIDCLFEPGVSVTLNASANKAIHFIRPSSGSPGDTPVEYDFAATGPEATFSQYNGGCKLVDVSNGQNISFNGQAAHLTIDSTCSNINIVVRGDTKITDNRATKTPAINDQTSAALTWQQSAALTVQKWIGLR